MYRLSFLAVGVLLLSSCDNTGQYLVFGSQHTYGLKIAVSGTASTDPVSIKLGDDLNNFAFVPVTTPNASQNAQPIRGCFVGGGAEGTVGDCTTAALHGQGVAGQPPEQHPKATPAVYTLAAAAQQPAPGNQTPPSQGNAKEQNSDSKIIVDGLSVFGSFNQTTDVGSSSGSTPSAIPTVGVNMGTVFATGVAAEHVGYGQQRLLTGSPQASVLTAVVNCMKEAHADGVPSAQIADLCKAGETTQQAANTPSGGDGGLKLSSSDGTSPVDVCAAPVTVVASGSDAANVDSLTINSVNSGKAQAVTGQSGEESFQFASAPYSASAALPNPVKVTVTKKDNTTQSSSLTAKCGTTT